MTSTPAPLERHSPRTFISIIDKDGSRLSTPESGVKFVLHFKSPKQAPYAAEILGQHNEQYSFIPLGWDGKKLMGYTGIHDLPIDLVAWLRELGYEMQEVERVSIPRRN